MRGRSITLTTAILACLNGACATSGNQATEVRPRWMGETELQPELFELDNGLTVIFQVDHSAPVVALQAWVNVGSADETPREAGLAHVHEHMLFKGTETRGVGEIAAIVEGSGGSINAWTSYDQTVYHVVVASRYTETGLDVLSDAIQHSAFDREELTRELEVIQEEIRRGNDMPARVLSRSLFDTAFESHPYGLPIIGTQASVASFTRDDVLQFFQKWYRPDNITLVAVGDFDEVQMRTLVESSFGAMSAAETTRMSRPVEEPQATLRAALTFQDIREGHLAVGFHVPGLDHADIPALELLSILLGQGESSMLFTELKRRRQIATEVYSYLYTPREPGILMTGGNFRGGDEGADPLEVLDGVLEQTFSLRQVTVSARDLRRAKTMLESETVYERETVQGRANRLGYFQVVAGDLAFEPRFFELAEQVTPEDIRRVARQYLTAENATVAFVLPHELEGTIDEEAIEHAVTSRFDNVEGLAIAADLTPDSLGVVRHEFPGGLTLLVQEDHSVPLVAVRGVFPGGLRFETDENNGVNMFLAEMLTEGTHSRTAEEIAVEIESMAGALNGFSGRNSIGLQLEVLSHEFEPALELLVDCALHSSFPEEGVARVRQQMLAEIAAQDDNLAGSAFRQFNRTLFRDHPFRFNTLGTRETIEGLSVDQLRTFFQTHLQPSHLTLAVVGDVSVESVIRAVERAFDVHATAEPLSVEVAPVERRPREEVVDYRERQQAHLVLGYSATDMSHPDRWALEVLAAVLSGQGGRLFYELRDRQSLAYSVSAFNLVGLDGGYFASYIATSPSKIEEAVTGIERELSRVREELVPQEELERAQRYLVGQREISLQRVGNRAAYLAFDEAYGMGHDHHYQQSALILAVTAQDIRRVAREYLNPDSGVLSVIRPTAAADTAE